MTREKLGRDKYGVQKAIKIGDYFADSLGQFAMNAMSSMVGRLTYFYTDKVGLAAGAVATCLLICKFILLIYDDIAVADDKNIVCAESSYVLGCVRFFIKSRNTFGICS